MLRRLFTLASAVSLGIALAAAVLWVRSYWVADGVGRARGGAAWSFWSVRGSLVFWRVKSSGLPDTDFKYHLQEMAGIGNGVRSR